MAIMLLLISFLLTNSGNFMLFPTYLGSPFIENDLDIKDFAKLLKRKKWEEDEEADKACKSCTASCHRVSALFNHDELDLSQLC